MLLSRCWCCDGCYSVVVQDALAVGVVGVVGWF